MNRVMMADSYKYPQAKGQYPSNVVGMFDYAEARSGKIYPETLFIGLQMILMDNFITPIEQWEVDEAYMYSQAHGVSFDKEGWDYIVQELGGHLPVKIRAVAEGTVVPVKNALFTIESTDAKVFWVASWLETILMTVWYPCNVATRSYYVRKMLEQYAEETQDNPFVGYQYHNFGARGSTNPYTAQQGGIAHLAAGFMGSDVFSAIQGVQKFYTVEDINSITHSINATEHSSTTAWGKNNEMDMIMNHLENNKGQAMIAAVLDSYDYLKTVQKICAQDGKFQRKINQDDYPIFVMRPDSGDPAEMINKTLNIMEEENVPFTWNDKGYKVFNKMRIIWGDGIDMESMQIMLKILKAGKYSSENIAFGSGGWLMQQHDRDTQGWAVKCSEITLEVEGNTETRAVFKNPVTAPNKVSKKGKMTLCANIKTGEFMTLPVDSPFIDDDIFDIMSTVYKNGKMVKTYSLDEIRANNA